MSSASMLFETSTAITMSDAFCFTSTSFEPNCGLARAYNDEKRAPQTSRAAFIFCSAGFAEDIFSSSGLSANESSSLLFRPEREKKINRQRGHSKQKQ